MSCGEERLKKTEGEPNIRKGQRLWLVRLKFVSVQGKGKPFGVAVKESNWPDLWVTVDVWNKEQFVDMVNPKNQRRAKCPMRLR